MSDEKPIETKTPALTPEDYKLLDDSFIRWDAGFVCEECGHLCSQHAYEDDAGWACRTDECTKGCREWPFSKCIRESAAYSYRDAFRAGALSNI